MTAMAAAVLDRVGLAGDELVLDAGCGTGRATELLLGRVPRGRVVAVDADPEMVGLARQNLPPQVRVIYSDLLSLHLDEPVDVVFSTATFHWILDHQRLFDTLFGLLKPGGRLVAQCGGAGNIDDLRRAGDEVASAGPYRRWFLGWSPPWYYAEAEQTAQRLAAAGFRDVQTWLQPWPVTPDDPHEYVATITLGAQVQRLPTELRDAYIDDVLARLAQPVTVDYVRLNIDAVKPPTT